VPIFERIPEYASTNNTHDEVKTRNAFKQKETSVEAPYRVQTAASLQKHKQMVIRKSDNITELRKTKVFRSTQNLK
jgi:hypothetical protein